jgi:hypothetical protein
MPRRLRAAQEEVHQLALLAERADAKDIPDWMSISDKAEDRGTVRGGVAARASRASKHQADVRGATLLTGSRSVLSLYFPTHRHE